MNLRERLFGYSDATSEEIAFLASTRSRCLREKVKWTLVYVLIISVILGVVGVVMISSSDQLGTPQDMIIVKAVFLGIFLLALIASYWITTLIVRRTHTGVDKAWLLKTIYRSRAPKDIIDEFRQKKKNQKC